MNNTQCKQTYELKAIHTSRKSYYGKACVRVYEDNTKELYSYNTLVARIDPQGNFTYLWNDYSMTTARHVHEFRLQNGLPPVSKKELLQFVALKNIIGGLDYVNK